MRDGHVLLSLVPKPLQRFIPTAAIFELNVQVFGVEPEHGYRSQERFSLPTFLLPLFRTDRFRPALIDPMTKTKSALVPQPNNSLGKVLVDLSRQ